MNLVGPALPPAPARPRARWLWPVLCFACLVVACAPSGDNRTAAEDTSVDEPGQESTEVEDGDGGDGAAAVAVELPGLPVGGNEVVFTPSDNQKCVSVSWTAGTLRDGVSVGIAVMAASGGFEVSSGPCEQPPCVGDFELTATASACDVWVVWDGEVVPEEAQLVAGRTVVTCVEQTVCDETISDIAQVGDAAIDLFGEPDPAAESDDTATSGETGEDTG